MTIAKGLSSGYAPIGGSILADEVYDVMATDEFYHGYTYSGHPMSCAVALENLRILEEENLVGQVRDVTAPYLAEAWARLGEHPLVGEARICGLMGALQLTPDKSARAAFAEGPGNVGVIARDFCFEDNFIMRHVGDQMIISPPLIFSKENIDTLAEKAWKVLDKTLVSATEKGLMKAA
jgi:putrescine aminotransferase